MNLRKATLRLATCIAALFIMLFGLASPAQAGCAVGAGNASFGNVSSFTAATTQTTAAATGFLCSGSVLSLLATNQVMATIVAADSDNGQLRLESATTADFIPYILCKDADCAATFNVGETIVWSHTSLLGLLGLFNASDGSMPIYIRTAAGANVAAGTYTSTININWDWDICTLAITDLLCLAHDRPSAPLPATVTITMVVESDCVINAPPADFGTAAFVDSFDPVTQTINVRCTKGSSYTIGIDDGLHYAGQRRLSAGSDYIAYEVYYPHGSDSRWGSSGGQRRDSSEATTNPGLPTGTADQGFTYRAEIVPGQSTPPAARYTDTLTVDIQF